MTAFEVHLDVEKPPACDEKSIQADVAMSNYYCMLTFEAVCKPTLITSLARSDHT